MPLPHVSPWFHSMFVGDKYRAHMLVNSDLLVRVHWAVFCHAVMGRHRELRGTTNKVVGSYEIPVHGRPPNTAISLDPEEVLWRAKVERDDMALEFFAGKKAELDTMGYRTLPGSMDDRSCPNSIRNQTAGLGEDVPEHVSGYFMD